MSYECNCGKIFDNKSRFGGHVRKCTKYIRVPYKNKNISKYKTLEGVYKCECNREFIKYQSLNGHFSHCKIHNHNILRKYDNTWNKGSTKQSDDRVKKCGISLSNRYKSGELIPSFKGKKHTEETKEKLRNARLKYLSIHSNRLTTAWYKNNKNIMTYGEKLLHDIFIKNDIYTIYNVTFQYRFKKYCLDFAFINEKIDVEFDGACHFTNGISRIEHDIKRDEFLKDNGWRTFRISYKEIHAFDINILLNFISNSNSDIRRID